MLKMLTSTRYDGKQYIKGKEYSVDKNAETRWIKNGIAEKQNKPTTDYFEQTNEDIREYLESLSDDELTQYAIDNGKDISKARTRAAAIRLLIK